MKITTKKIIYLGHLQGYKIYINNKKYPNKKGHFYTYLNKNEAIKKAIIESIDFLKYNINYINKIYNKYK